MKLKIDKTDCKINEIKIPKGYRVIEDWELMKELRTNTELQEIFENGIWVKRIIDGQEVIRASWCGILNDSSVFSAGDCNDRLRGIFTLKKMKAEYIYNKKKGKFTWRS